MAQLARATNHDPDTQTTTSSYGDTANSLPNRINSATRSIHAQLNRLITARLPLALWPHSKTSSTYIAGLLHVLPIYAQFESLWQEFLKDAAAATPDVSVASKRAKMSSNTQTLLASLKVAGLPRTKRLRADIGTLSGLSNAEVQEQLGSIAHTGQLEQFLTHTKMKVEEKPYVLAAYAWVLYMALFAGGRYLRASIRESGTNLWEISTLPGTTAPESQPHAFGLQFFHFDGEEDGEDIKKDFKRRMLEADTLLTEAEKLDVIEEAQHIFSFMIGIVGDLDALFGTADAEMDVSLRHAASGCTRHMKSALRGHDDIGQEDLIRAHAAANAHRSHLKATDSQTTIQSRKHFHTIKHHASDFLCMLGAISPKNVSTRLPLGGFQSLSRIFSTSLIVIALSLIAWHFRWIWSAFDTPVHI